MQLNSSNPKDGRVESARARFWRQALSVSVAAGLVVAAALGYTRTTSADNGEPPTCSNRTLRGDYGFGIDGTILAGPAAGLLRGVAMTHFDGHGNTSQVDFTTRNGVPVASDWLPATGTYEINDNCTGSAVLNFEDARPDLHLRLVVVDGGRQVISVVEGNATGSWGVRVR